jgi:hypothetical protein
MVFTIASTPVRVHPSVVLNLLVGWGTLSWLAGPRGPERCLLKKLVIGALSMAMLIAAGIGLAARRRRLAALVPGGWGVVTIVDSLGWAPNLLRDRAFGQPGSEGNG